MASPNTTGDLFGIVYHDLGGGGHQFVCVIKTTGASTLIGALGMVATALEIADDGTACTFGSDGLAAINRTTGAATRIGGSLSWMDDLAFDGAGTLCGVAGLRSLRCPDAAHHRRAPGGGHSLPRRP